MRDILITSFLTAALLIILGSHPVKAVSNFYPTQTSSDSIRVGLVLSGGGAKGLAHISIIKALEDAGVTIDYITGTSMGALIGGLYSIGYTTDQLIEIGKSNTWDEMFTEKPSRQFLSNYQREFDDRTIVTFPIGERGLELPFGIIEGQSIYTFLSRYTWPVHAINEFDDFLIPFAAVATELESGNPVTFRSGYLPDAIRASISIPSLMVPHKIDDVSYIDGGLSNNLPVDVAKEMGANFIIAVNVASPLVPQDSIRSISDVINQVVNYQINANIKNNIEEADIYIVPEGIIDFDILDFDKIDDFLRVGKNEADKYLEEFQSIATRQNRNPEPRHGIDNFGSLPFNKIIIEGNREIGDQFILEELLIPEGALLTPEFIEERINRLYSTQLFDLITYRVVPDESSFYNLQVYVVENTTNLLRVGVRYETKTQAAILLDAEFQNLLHPGSSNRLDIRLGDEIRIRGDYLLFGSVGSRFALKTTLMYQSENLDIFDTINGSFVNVGRYTNHLTRGKLSVGNYLSSQYLVSFGLRQDFIYHNNVINPAQILQTERDHHSLFSIFKYDRLNRKSFPNSGTQAYLKGEYSNSLILSPIDYISLSGYWNSYFNLSDYFTFNTSLYSGISNGDELPWESWFSVNRFDKSFGFLRFGGFNRYELTSRNIQMASIGVRAEPIYHRFIGMDIYAGKFMEEWNFLNFDGNESEFGASLTLGALTILGPVKGIISSSTKHSLLVELQIGYHF